MTLRGCSNIAPETGVAMFREGAVIQTDFIVDQSGGLTTIYCRNLEVQRELMNLLEDFQPNAVEILAQHGYTSWPHFEIERDKGLMYAIDTLPDVSFDYYGEFTI